MSASPLWSAMVEAGARAIWEVWRLSTVRSPDDWKVDTDWEMLCRWADDPAASTEAPKALRALALKESDAALRALGKLRESRKARYISTDDIDALLAEADEGKETTR